MKKIKSPKRLYELIQDEREIEYHDRDREVKKTFAAYQVGRMGFEGVMEALKRGEFYEQV